MWRQGYSQRKRNRRVVFSRGQMERDKDRLTDIPKDRQKETNSQTETERDKEKDR